MKDILEQVAVLQFGLWHSAKTSSFFNDNLKKAAREIWTGFAYKECEFQKICYTVTCYYGYRVRTVLLNKLDYLLLALRIAMKDDSPSVKKTQKLS